jgi:hypothetical protein
MGSRQELCFRVLLVCHMETRLEGQGIFRLVDRSVDVDIDCDAISQLELY